MLRFTLLLLATCAHALRLSAPATRRAVVFAAPALTMLPLASQAAGDRNAKVGYACRGDEDCGVDALAKLKLTNTPGTGEAAGIRFAGTYNDPAYPGLPRKLILAGTNVIITGKNAADGKEWKVKGKPYGKALVLDLTPAGGAVDTIARWNGLGLAFEDGNVWKKK